MARVVGTDPGTSSLDLLLLVDGVVADQERLTPEALRDDAGRIAATLGRWGPIDLVAGPSGYGLPLTRASDVCEADLDLMALVRPDERGRDQGVLGFRRVVREFVASGVPTVFLPGGIHLPTIPAHRKRNAIDMATPDKLCVAAMALRMQAAGLDEAEFAVVEVGTAFTSVMVVSGGRLVDAASGTRGPIGLRSGGAWDGEAAYWLGSLSKADLFRGGVADLGEDGAAAFRESLRKALAGLHAVTSFRDVYLSGAGLERPDVQGWVTEATLGPAWDVVRLESLPGAWVKHAAQGAALLADGLAGGGNADLVESLRLREARGTAIDFLPGRGG